MEGSGVIQMDSNDGYLIEMNNYGEQMLDKNKSEQVNVGMGTWIHDKN